MLIALSRYTKTLEEVDAHRDAHIRYIKSFITSNKLLAAGRQTPPTGAVIIAGNITLDEFKNILANDPYCKENVAEYNIVEFNPVLCDESFHAFIS